MPGKQFGNATAAFRRVATNCADVAVWQTGLDVETAEVQRCAELLSADERARAARYHFERDRRRFIVARGRLRLLLGEHLGLSPAAIAFDYTRSGKPFLRDIPVSLHFNVAHTEGLAIYAVSTSWQTGVDVECVDRELDCAALARRFFTSGECRAVEEFPESHRKRAFLACWTRKEAVVKATGDGLALPLDQFEVTVDPDATPRILASQQQRIAGCKLYTAGVGRTDYVAALATYRNTTTD